MGVKEKLLKVQLELNAPKSLVNTFSHFNYRSCEAILESLKPLLSKYQLLLVLTDSVKSIGDRNYVVAKAILTDIEGGDSDFIEATAYACEQTEKKGMDAAQITGAASSYARKYALNGLFAIDDARDADTDEYNTKVASPPQPGKVSLPQSSAGWTPQSSSSTTVPPSKVQLDRVNSILDELEVSDEARDKILDQIKSFKQAAAAIADLSEKRNTKNKKEEFMSL